MIPIDEFRTSYTHHELGCTLQRVEMEKCQRNPEDIKKYGPLTEEQMERRAKVRGLLALVRTTNGKKRIEFVNRDFNAAINVRCAVLEKRPRRSTRVNFIGQPLKVELYEKKLEAVVRAGRERLGGVCTSVADVVCFGRVSRHYCTADRSVSTVPPEAFATGAHASHCMRQGILGVLAST